MSQDRVRIANLLTNSAAPTQRTRAAASLPALQARFEAIEDKLKLVQENLKYFLEIMQHKKSDALEWTVRMSDESHAMPCHIDCAVRVTSA